MLPGSLSVQVDQMYVYIKSNIRHPERCTARLSKAAMCEVGSPTATCCWVLKRPWMCMEKVPGKSEHSPLFVQGTTALSCGHSADSITAVVLLAELDLYSY